MIFWLESVHKYVAKDLGIETPSFRNPFVGFLESLRMRSVDHAKFGGQLNICYRRHSQASDCSVGLILYCGG